MPTGKLCSKKRWFSICSKHAKHNKDCEMCNTGTWINVTEVYEFVYTDCIHESAMATISLHRTKLGAYKAMRKFLNDSYMEWYNFRIIYGKRWEWSGAIDKFGNHCAWSVRTIILND